MCELWITLPPFLWSLSVCQKKLTPVPALQEAEPIKVDAGISAPCPGLSPLFSVHTQILWFISVMGTVVGTKERERALALKVSQPQGEGTLAPRMKPNPSKDLHGSMAEGVAQASLPISVWGKENQPVLERVGKAYGEEGTRRF